MNTFTVSFFGHREIENGLYPLNPPASTKSDPKMLK